MDTTRFNWTLENRVNLIGKTRCADFEETNQADGGGNLNVICIIFG